MYEVYISRADAVRAAEIHRTFAELQKIRGDCTPISRKR